MAEVNKGPRGVDWFDVDIEYLNSHMRTIVDAIKSRIIHEGNVHEMATDQIQHATNRLEYAAVMFTQELYGKHDGTDSFRRIDPKPVV